MFGRFKDFVSNCIDYKHIFLKNKEKLDKLLYMTSSEKFEYKLEKYGSSLVVPFFYIREALTKAIKEGDERIVYRCCRLKDNTDIDESTAWSIVYNNEDDKCYSYMKPPMHFAAQCGSVSIIPMLAQYYSVSDICRYIYHKENRCFYEVSEGAFTPMHFASTGDTVKCLMELGADIEAVSAHGTPFYKAVEAGNIDVIIALYEAGVNINYIDPTDGPVLLRVTQLVAEDPKKYTSVLSLLCDLRADPFATNSEDGIAISYKRYDVYTKPLFLYTLRSILSDITDLSCIIGNNLYLVNALELSGQFKAIDDVYAKKALIKFCSEAAENNKNFFMEVIPDACRLGLVCKNFCNTIFSTNFEFDMKSNTFLPEEILFNVLSQSYDIHPAILQSIMRGNVVVRETYSIKLG